MKLGIIGAMEVEVAAIRSEMRGASETTVAGMTFCAGRLGTADAVVVKCGVGKVNAALCTQILCDRFAPTHLVNTGVAGSLSPSLGVCDMVISEDAMYHDFDCCPLGYAMGNVPELPPTFAADEALIRLARRACEAVNTCRTAVGRVASGDQFVSSHEQKQRIAALTNALCTEMEGAAIAHAAYRNGVPFVILRAISDNADGNSTMDYPTFERIAALQCAKTVIAMAAMLPAD